jgi:hypothetical protein
MRFKHCDHSVAPKGQRVGAGRSLSGLFYDFTTETMQGYLVTLAPVQARF